MRGRMKVAGILGAACVLAVLLLGVPAQAANPEQVNVSATVAEALRLTVSTNTVDFGGAGLLPDGGAALDGVYTDSLDATVWANRNWRLQVSKDQDLTSGSNFIPSSRLTFTSASGDGRVSAVRGSATEFGTGTMVAEGTKGGSIGPVTVNYRVDIDWEDEPGTYTAVHTYTVVGR